MSHLPTILTGLIGVAAVVIAWLGYRFSRQQARESWLRTYKELHEKFWNDAEFREVRAWLAYEVAYALIEPVLEKRKSLAKKEEPCSLVKEEYEILEKLDRFLNFLLGVIVINPEFGKNSALWQQLYFAYWLKRFGDSNRRDLRWYLCEFYPELYKMMRESRKEKGPDRFLEVDVRPDSPGGKESQ